jgi:flagellar FliJ protein
MTFRFRLQRVLELREESEQARARALRAASDDASEARRRQDALAGLRALQRDALAAASRGLITAGEMQHLTFLIGALDDRLVRAADDVAEAERVVAEAQQALQHAARDRRVLDRLKERHGERWQEHQQQRDRHAMDEIALTRFTRRADGGAPGAPAAATPTPIVPSEESTR